MPWCSWCHTPPHTWCFPPRLCRAHPLSVPAAAPRGAGLCRDFTQGCPRPGIPVGQHPAAETGPWAAPAGGSSAGPSPLPGAAVNPPTAIPTCRHTHMHPRADICTSSYTYMQIFPHGAMPVYTCT